ncbi:MAG: prepilin-type N-terminal cleavage/methylation domain-containing protein [Bdellovibrionales bacterium]|nr:prepilin-type N-terminal cleavage/methylation domain-containing protein [Bdellovibrionales bacterium]
MGSQLKCTGHLKPTHRASGFSLIELMLIVSIIGVLATIGAVNYDEFVRRTQISQAKSGLADIYAAEEIHRSETGQYTTRLNALNYQPQGTVHFNLGFDNDFAPPAGFPQGSEDCSRLCNSLCPGTFIAWRCTESAGHDLDGASTARVTATTFRAGAHAHFTPSPSDWFSFTIDQTKSIRAIIPAN